MRKQGVSSMPEYGVWRKMRERCNVKTNPNYQYYGGRGIRVCSRWHSFAAFLSDMGPRPDDQHTIERIDVNGNYEPSNCRWLHRSRQSSNTRASRFLEFRGERKTVTDWSSELGVSVDVLYKRLRLGWGVERVLTEPIRDYRKTVRPGSE